MFRCVHKSFPLRMRKWSHNFFQNPSEAESKTVVVTTDWNGERRGGALEEVNPVQQPMNVPQPINAQPSTSQLPAAGESHTLARLLDRVHQRVSTKATPDYFDRLQQSRGKQRPSCSGGNVNFASTPRSPVPLAIRPNLGNSGMYYTLTTPIMAHPRAQTSDRGTDVPTFCPPMTMEKPQVFQPPPPVVNIQNRSLLPIPPTPYANNVVSEGQQMAQREHSYDVRQHVHFQEAHDWIDAATQQVPLDFSQRDQCVLPPKKRKLNASVALQWVTTDFWQLHLKLSARCFLDHPTWMIEVNTPFQLMIEGARTDRFDHFIVFLVRSASTQIPITCCQNHADRATFLRGSLLQPHVRDGRVMYGIHIQYSTVQHFALYVYRYARDGDTVILPTMYFTCPFQCGLLEDDSAPYKLIILCRNRENEVLSHLSMLCKPIQMIQ